MIVFLIFIFSVLLMVGVCVLLAGVTKYASYATTEGEVIKLLDCSFCDEGVQLEVDERAKPVAALISYSVGTETYQLTTADRKVLKAGKKHHYIQVFYNPYNPAEARLKGGSPFLGLILIIASTLAIVLLIAL